MIATVEQLRPAAPAGSDEQRVAQAVERIAREIALELDVDEIARRVVDAVQAALEPESAAVLLVEGSTLRFAAAAGPAAEPLIDRRVPAAAGICGEVLRTGAPVLVEDATADPRVFRKVDRDTGYTTRTLLAAPLVARGRTIGVIEAVNRLGRTAPFGPGELLFLERLAPHAAAALANATLAAELRRSRDELARHAETLEQRVADRTRMIGNAKREWELSFDSIEDPLGIVEGTIVRRANVAFARAGGFDVRQVPGQPCYRAAFGRVDPCPGCPVEAARRAGLEKAEGELRLDGRIIAARAFAFDDPARPDTWVVSYHDATEQRRMAERLRDAEHHSAIGRLAAGAAHEINNPLAFVTAGLRVLRENLQQLGGLAEQAVTAAGLVRGGHLAPARLALERLAAESAAMEVPAVVQECGAVLDEAETGASRVVEIVRALKILGKEELGHDQRCDPADSLERAVQRARRTGRYPAQLRWGRREPLEITGRPLQLDQAFFEVVKNALQACSSPRESVVLSAFRDGDRAVLEVTDEGCGIADADRTRILDPFFTTRGVGGGVGLGLTIAFGVVKNHGGELDVRSREGAGTTVRVVLPLAPGSGTLPPLGKDP